MHMSTVDANLFIVLFKNTRMQDVYRLLNDIFVCEVNYFIGFA